MTKVLFYCSSKTYSYKLLVIQKERHQSQINQNFGTICHTEVCLTFLRFTAKLSELKIFEMAASYFNREHPLTSRASKTALQNILKVASNQCSFSKDWWEVWIVGRDRTKTKCPKEWGVSSGTNFCKQKIETQPA